MQEIKHIKITLFGVKGRVLPHNQIFNEFINEHIISSVNIKVRDLEARPDIMVHEIPFDMKFYNPGAE